MKTIQNLLGVLVCSLLMGCATGISFMMEPDGVYPATKIDCLYITEEVPAEWSYDKRLVALDLPIIILDFPVSIVLDTVMFPYDLFFRRVKE